MCRTIQYSITRELYSISTVNELWRHRFNPVGYCSHEQSANQVQAIDDLDDTDFVLPSCQLRQTGKITKIRDIS